MTDGQSPPGPDAARRSLPGRLISLPGGAVLAACFFLPAVRGCSGEPIHPYDVPAFTAPYAIGLVVAVFAVLALVLRERIPRALSIGYAAVCGLTTLSGAVFFAWGTVAETLDGWNGWARMAPLVVPLAGCLALSAHAAQVLRRDRSHAWRSARATWTAGATVFLWLLMWAMDRYGLLYGWWLSAASSLLVAAGGALLERAAREAGTTRARVW